MKYVDVCHYCAGTRSMRLKLTDQTADIDMEIAERKIHASYSGFGYFGETEVEISYCPMCGRRL